MSGTVREVHHRQQRCTLPSEIKGDALPLHGTPNQTLFFQLWIRHFKKLTIEENLQSSVSLSLSLNTASSNRGTQ